MNIPAQDLDVWSQALVALDALVPYAAPITARMIPVPVVGIDSSISCDPQFRVYFDPAYARRVGVNVFAADLLHETLHLLSDHPTRATEAGVTPETHLRWNVAADLAINGTVFAIAASKGSLSPGGQRFQRPNDASAIRASGWLHPSVYQLPDGLLAEDYFEALGKGQQPQKPQQGQQGQPGQPGQQGSPGRGSCGSCTHGDEDSDSAVQQAAKAAHGELPAGPSESEQRALRQEAAEAIAAHEAAHGRGSVPAGLVRVADQLRRPPKVDWRRRLAAVVRGHLSASRGAADFAFTRPRWRDGVAAPRLMAPAVRVAIVADTSGSMGADDLGRVLDETRGVLRAGSVASVWWIATDSEAHKPVALRDLTKAALLGGGGTDMGAGLEAAAALRPRPQVTVVLTDGDTDWPSTQPACGRVVVVRTRSSTAPTPSWASVVDAY